ncbi:hypothetical protein [Streptomyces sp. NBC_01716]|uniref:hypothetical protein n=1 Tax=Streptomyces sp. NBC_01716 TaxID=2975917 RepID=UPI002E3376D6|nr:hypothetical protein [Streptomyces sp. NBC_01716]
MTQPTAPAPAPAPPADPERETGPAHGFAELDSATTDGHAPATATVTVLLGWLTAFGSYAVMFYRESARTA